MSRNDTEMPVCQSPSQTQLSDQIQLLTSVGADCGFIPSLFRFFQLARELFYALPHAQIDAGDFLEHAKVHQDLYGTLREPVLANLKKGLDVLIDIDTQGAAMIRNCDDRIIRQALADIFIMMQLTLANGSFSPSSSRK